MVFDGEPADGNVVAWKRAPVADGKQVRLYVFEWVPSVCGDHTLVAEVLHDHDDPHPGQNQASLNVEVVGPYTGRRVTNTYNDCSPSFAAP